ncbi:MAG: hypothetical protein U0842_10960 [Candidatus Binatia bacterium]
MSTRASRRDPTVARPSTCCGRRAGLLAALLLSACATLGPPPMEPLTGAALDAAEGRWRAHATGAYHLVVSVRAPRFEPAVYELDVAAGRPLTVTRNGDPLGPAELAHHDYSIDGLFALLRSDLTLNAVTADGDIPPIDLRAAFEPESGRLVRYRRTVGSSRRRVLLVEVMRYEELPAARVASVAG